MQENSNQRQRPGWICGVMAGLKLLEIPLEVIVPQRIERGSAEFERGLLGIYSLTENGIAAMALMRYPNKCTSEFRKDLAEGIRNTVTRPEVKITLSDVLRLRVELEHFCKLNIDWLNRDGAEAIMGTRYSFQEAFQIMQEVRALQFSAMATTPIAEMRNVPESANKFSGAMIRAAHMWVLGTTTFSDSSMAETDRIVEPICAIARATCDSFLNPNRALEG